VSQLFFNHQKKPIRHEHIASELQKDEKKSGKKVEYVNEPSSPISHVGTTSSQRTFSSQIGRDVEYLA
jgi:hypothetical protein